MRVIIFAIILFTIMALALILDSFEPSKTTLLVGDAKIRIEIADTPQERFRGLSGRFSLSPDRGMFFIFDAPGRYSFVMRLMNFDLDFIWIDKDGRIVHINENVPKDYPGEITPPVPIRYVLEVNAGWSKAHGVKIGEIVKNSFGR